MDHVFELMIAAQKERQIQQVLECNQKTERFGLSLSQQEAGELMAARQETLKEKGRVEFGGGILPELIDTFCDSLYISQDNYAETLGELQDMFYEAKNESEDEMTDQEILDFMKQQFEEVCAGDLDYLRNTCLERLTRAVRSGWRGRAWKQERDEYSLRKQDNEYGMFSEEEGWDYVLYGKCFTDDE